MQMRMKESTVRADLSARAARIDQCLRDRSTDRESAREQLHFERATLIIVRRLNDSVRELIAAHRAIEVLARDV